MNFEKKYWSTNEYKDNNGVNFIGYVGILNGDAYDIKTNSLLSKNDNYITHINCSSDNYDRVLSKELKLPYGRNDILFAANDFLSSGAFKIAVERLQSNNNYLFKNSIISNSNLPATNECIVFSSWVKEENTDDNSNTTVKEIPENEQGILRKFNFADCATKVKTSLDPTFYPKTKTEEKYYIYNKFGEKLEVADDKTKYTKGWKLHNEPSEDDYTDLKEIWENYNYSLDYGEDNKSFDDKGEITREEIDFYLYDNIPNNKHELIKNVIISGNLEGEYKTLEVDSNIDTEIRFNSNIINNLFKTYGADTNFTNLSVMSLGFIIKGEIPENISLLKVLKNTNIKDETENEEENYITSKYKQKFTISDEYTYVIYNFNLEKINLEKITQNESAEFILKIRANKKTEFLCEPDGTDKVKNIIKYQIGTKEDSQEEKIINVERYVDYSYVWESEEDGKVVEHIAEPNFSYKFLIESDDWLQSTNPRLKNSTWTDNEINKFIPNETMTAADVFQCMVNDPSAYWFPAIYRKNVEYKSLGITGNPKFKEAVYPINSYKFEIGEDNISRVVKGFKSATDIYTDLYTDIETGLIVDSEIENVNCIKSLYDKVPNVFKEYHIVTDNENEVLHNFNEIKASQIIARDFDEENKSCNLIIFLLFKTKVLLFKTKYYYNTSLEQTGNKNYIDFQSLESDIKNDDLKLDLSKNGDWIEIANIDPDDNNSLKFLNLNAIKVYKNMLYLVDSELDMVLRYSIDYIVSTYENLDSVFNKKSIRLLDIMQGNGTNKDKIYFNKPYSIDVADSGVYIVDRNNSCIKSYTHSLNYKKTFKNGFFSSHDIQAVAINPYPCVIDNVKINKDSIWIASVLGDRIFLSVLENDIVKVYRQIENIVLLQDNYTWLEEIRGLHFSKAHTNYFYLNTSKRTYKFHVSNPFYPFASLSYYKQRSLVGSMRWTAMRYPWDKVPSLYGISNLGSTEGIKNEITWDYLIPTSSAEILDNKCFCLTGNNLVEGDIIFHFTVLYDNSKIRNYINQNKPKFNNMMSFYDIESGILAQMIKSSSMLLYIEPDSFISSLSSNNMPIYDTKKIENLMGEDYINPITANKIFYSLVHNLLTIKNSLLGKFRAATNLDGVIVYDNLILDDYFNNLTLENNTNYFIHENEHLSIIINRVLEEIIDIQEKIINKMQTEFFAAQSYVNNTSRYI